MNPMFQTALAAFFRWMLAFAGGYAIRYGIWTKDETTMYIEGASLAIVALLWSLLNHYKSRLTLLTAIATTEPTTENNIKQAVALGIAPSVSTPKDAVPQLTAGGNARG